MSDWPKIRIKDITSKVGSGATPRGGESAYQESGTPLIRSLNVHFDGFRRDGLAFLNDAQANELRSVEVRAEDVLLNITGASIGRVTQAPSDMDGARVSQHVCIIRPREPLQPAFLRWFLATPSQQSLINREQTGATRQGLTKEKILNFEVPIPSPAEQRRIVAKIEELFSDLEAGVAALRRARANLKRYRAAVLKAAVEGDLTAEWRAQHPNTEPASALLTRILKQRREQWEATQLAKFQAAGKEPPKGWREKYVEPSPPDTNGLAELPKAWCWASVEQIGNVQLGRQRSPQNRSNEYPTKYIRAANLTESGLDLSDVLDMDFQPRELETYRLYPGDILLSEASGSPDQVGKPVVWNDEIENCCFQNTVIRLRPVGLPTQYALAVFRYYYRSKLFAKVSAGVGINHLSANKFSALPFPLAPLAEQQQIINIVAETFSQIDAAEAPIERDLLRAGRLRQSILQQAFTGRLVPQDPTDEPASALLERLRVNSTARSGDHDPATPTPARHSRKQAAPRSRRRAED